MRIKDALRVLDLITAGIAVTLIAAQIVQVVAIVLRLSAMT